MNRTTMPTLSILTCLILTALASADGRDELDEAMEVLDRLDRTTISVDYAEEPLAVVVNDLADRIGVPVRGDWEALWRLGIRPKDPVSFSLSRVPASTAVAGLMLVLGDEYSRPVYEVHTGQLVFTTVRGTEPMRLTSVYDVRDLLSDTETMQRLRDERPPMVASPASSEPAAPDPEQQTEGTGEEVEDEPASASEVPSPAKQLMWLLLDHVDPEAWIDFGGNRGRMTEHHGLLMVSVTPTTHRKLHRALARLRRAMPSAVDLEAALIDLPAAALTRARRNDALSSRRLARAVLRDPETQLLWRTSSTTAIGATLEVEAEAPERTLSLRVVPRLDRTTGMLTLEVEASVVEGADQRRVATTASIAYRDGAAVIELPAAAGISDVHRLLVLVPERR
jgi:hypothetical protein